METPLEIFNNLAQTYPLMRGGAVLFIIVGLGIVIGGIVVVAGCCHP